MQAFKDIEISQGFFFSYTYDITHSLQYNVLRQINIQNEKMAKYSMNSPPKDLPNLDKVVSEKIKDIIDDNKSDNNFIFSEEAKGDQGSNSNGIQPP